MSKQQPGKQTTLHQFFAVKGNHRQEKKEENGKNAGNNSSSSSSNGNGNINNGNENSSKDGMNLEVSSSSTTKGNDSASVVVDEEQEQVNEKKRTRDEMMGGAAAAVDGSSSSSSSTTADANVIVISRSATLSSNSTISITDEKVSIVDRQGLVEYQKQENENKRTLAEAPAAAEADASSSAMTREGTVNLDAQKKPKNNHVNLEEEDDDDKKDEEVDADKDSSNHEEHASDSSADEELEAPVLLPLSGEESRKLCLQHNLKSTYLSVQIGKFCLISARGSTPEFEGDVAVNAANNGGVDGGGIDGAFNTKGGNRFVRARMELPADRRGNRIQTGGAVCTKAAGDLKCKYVIHAVGPNYYGASYQEMAERDQLLLNAYQNIIHLATTELKNVESIGCCLLSAGVFAGERGVEVIMQIGCWSLLTALSTLPQNLKPLTVFLIAFTEEEGDMLQKVSKEIFTKFVEEHAEEAE